MEKIKGIVDLVANDILPRENNYSLGFKLKGHSTWDNIKGPQVILESIKRDMLAKGNEIEFEIKDGYATNFTLLSKSQSSAPAIRPASSTPKKFEDEMVRFEDLLSKAHEKFGDRFEIKTEMLQLDMEKKFALFKAKVIITNKENNYEQIFEGHGDATKENVKGLIAPHFIRMAETRSIVRALRWATNNATCSEEEK